MTIYDHITRDHEMSSRTRATIDDLRAQVAKLEAQLEHASYVLRKRTEVTK